MLKALQAFYGERGVSYYSLIHNGVRFCEYVGVIQIGSYTIEVLPKTDKNGDKRFWRDALIGMLKAVGDFNTDAPSSSALNLKANSILELYYELFVRETEYILYRGLVKQYRKADGNVSALKGSLQFSKHLQQNLVHQERFYVRHTTYDTQHLLHSILHKALRLLNRINQNPDLSSRIGALLLNFPEMLDVCVSEELFNRIQFNRKTESYQYAIKIARLLLLNYHPDLSRGQNDVLALMFDMNLLWERFVYVSLRNNKDVNTKIKAQNTKSFWKPNKGYKSSVRPDILIEHPNGENVVLDTKWKNINNANPSVDDLRQMYVYSNYYNADNVALVYPGQDYVIREGNYYDPNTNDLTNKNCSVISLPVFKNNKNWQIEINNGIKYWINDFER